MLTANDFKKIADLIGSALEPVKNSLSVLTTDVSVLKKDMKIVKKDIRYLKKSDKLILISLDKELMSHRRRLEVVEFKQGMLHG